MLRTVLLRTVATVFAVIFPLGLFIVLVRAAQPKRLLEAGG
ncbi:MULTISPECIES: hypothetical protein [Mycolicibacterium]|jgi:hypothetical protein|nr:MULTISPECIES: hypothetical protein [Mycolicibacterium]